MRDCCSQCGKYPSMDRLRYLTFFLPQSAIQLMISGALNLHTLKLDVHWTPYLSHTIKLSGRLPPPEASPTHPHYLGMTFTPQNATDLMLTLENPKLRVIGIGRRQFIVRLCSALS